MLILEKTDPNLRTSFSSLKTRKVKGNETKSKHKKANITVKIIKQKTIQKINETKLS